MNVSFDFYFDDTGYLNFRCNFKYRVIEYIITNNTRIRTRNRTLWLSITIIVRLLDYL